ncbi:MAG: GyrI-like domain-containing protein [Planctomycetes bacterium]|nr:GyrI-like domain-containing protein [Planctomycetota bacterium]
MLEIPTMLLRLSPIALLAACSVAPDTASAPTRVGGSPATFVADLTVARAPFRDVQVDWKQRLDQPYVFVEARGNYTHVGRSLERVFALAAAEGLEPSGAPFALYYDDPGKVAVDELRLRACLPLARPFETRGELRYDVLESTTVAYAFIAGPYPEVPRSYPALFSYLARMDWVENGPIREIYLVNPGEVQDFAELVTEVQVPATAAR